MGVMPSSGQWVGAWRIVARLSFDHLAMVDHVVNRPNCPTYLREIRGTAVRAAAMAPRRSAGGRAAGHHGNDHGTLGSALDTVPHDGEP